MLSFPFSMSLYSRLIGLFSKSDGSGIQQFLKISYANLAQTGWPTNFYVV